ncbi:F-box only protein 15 [Plecturocebus cupreus]
MPETGMEQGAELKFGASEKQEVSQKMGGEGLAVAVKTQEHTHTALQVCMRLPATPSDGPSFLGQTYSMDYVDAEGRVHVELVWIRETEEYFIVNLVLYLTQGNTLTAVDSKRKRHGQPEKQTMTCAVPQFCALCKGKGGLLVSEVGMVEEPRRSGPSSAGLLEFAGGPLQTLFAWVSPVEAAEQQRLLPASSSESFVPEEHLLDASQSSPV